MCKFCDGDDIARRRKMEEKAALGARRVAPQEGRESERKKKKSDHKHLIAQERVETYRYSWSDRPYKVIYFNCVICGEKPSRKWQYGLTD